VPRAAVARADVGGRQAVHPQGLADPPRRGARVRAGRGTTGADGPDRLIGDDDAIGRDAADVSQVAIDLALQDRLGLVGGELRLGLADAEDRAQARAEDAPELSRDAGVVVALIATDLRVADDRADGEAAEHRHAELPGERAGRLPVDVLGVDRDVRAA